MDFEFENFLHRISFELDVENNPSELTSTSRSFANVFSHLFGCTSEYIFQNLKNPNLITKKNFFLQKEFKNQKEWIKTVEFIERSEFLPILYSCASICNTFQHDVILICGLLNLSFIHRSQRFINICSENSSGNFVVVCLDNNNIFKLLKYHGTREDIISVVRNIPDYAIISMDEEGSEDEDEMNNINYSRFTNFQIYKDFNESVENFTIRQYLNRHFRSSTNGLSVADSSYTNNNRIDIDRSDFRYSHEYIFSFRRTLDIDAFFGLFGDVQFQECLVGGGHIVNFKDMSKSKREIDSLKKLFQDCGMNEFTKFKCIKIAELESPHSYEVYSVAAGTNLSQGFEAFDMKSLLESAHFDANRFPCISENCNFSKEHLAARNGRPDFYTQIKSYSFKWDYEPNSFKCLIKGMLAYLRNRNSSLNGINIYIYVKCIGSKFKSVFTSLSQVDSAIRNFLSPFDLKKLLTINESRVFLDLAWNINPNEYFDKYKVRFIIYLQKINLFLAGLILEWSII